MWHLVAQLYPTLWDSTDCSPPNSSVHGISQARILDWAAISFSRASSWPRDRTRVSCIAGGLFTSKSPREVLVKVDLLLTAAHSGCCRLPRAEEGHVTLNPHRQSLEEQLYSSLPRWMTPRQALERHQDLRVHHQSLSATPDPSTAPDPFQKPCLGKVTWACQALVYLETKERFLS